MTESGSLSRLRRFGQRVWSCACTLGTPATFDPTFPPDRADEPEASRLTAFSPSPALPAGAGDGRGQRGGAGVEALENRALLSAASAGLSGGWDVALIDRTLANASILERAMLPGGRVITYDGRSESPNEVLDRVISWAQSSGCRIQSL